MLPDGIWFGEVVGFGGFTDPAAPAAMSFDLACYFTGDAATQARIADGMSGESDYDEYVRNQNPKIYEIMLSPSAEVWSIPGTGSFFPELIPVSAWPRPDGYFTCPGVPPGAFCPVWIYVNGGIVTGFVEMFFE
ncbi:MAG: hypothetical protein HZA58_08930 [Acidimicrobiia bacterium]|nr:hypothetical protein [Acidimicrobiia bacterium]